MDVKEAIDELLYVLDIYSHEYGKTDYTRSAFDMAIETLERTRWIPVSERLPTEKDADTETGLVLYKQSNGWMFTDYWFVAEMGKSAITHWMPLPKPQEVKE